MKKQPARPQPSPLTHDNRLHCCLLHFPSSVSSDFSLHYQHQLFIIAFYFKHRIKEECYKYHMWRSRLSSSGVMWLHKPPTVSLLLLDTPQSGFMVVNKQKTCRKEGQKRSNNKLILLPQCVHVWSVIVRIPLGRLGPIVSVWHHLWSQSGLLCWGLAPRQCLWGYLVIMETRNSIHEWKEQSTLKLSV